MKRFIFILLVFIGVKGVGQQPVFVTAAAGGLYSLNLNNCTSHLVGSDMGFFDIAFTPDGKLWGINGDLFLVDTSNASVTDIGGTLVTSNSVSLVALNDSTLLCESDDSLYGINLRNGQSFTIGKIGYYADGDLSWYGNDLYMAGFNDLYDGLIIKIVLNSTYSSILSSAPINNANTLTPEFLGLATVSLNGSDSIIGFTNDGSAYKISPVDGTIKQICSSLPKGTAGAASISYPSSLPVHLINLTSDILNKTVQLQWQTTSEINSSYFLIQRSSDGINFSNIGKINAAGNSNSLRQYSFVDQAPLSQGRGGGGEAYYRLQEVDLDGKYTYSKIVQVNIPQTQALIILGNPVQNNLQIQINNSTSSTNYLSIFDFTGRRLKTFNAQNGAQNIDVSFLTTGTYVLQMITADGKVYNKVFVKR